MHSAHLPGGDSRAWVRGARAVGASEELDPSSDWGGDRRPGHSASPGASLRCTEVLPAARLTPRTASGLLLAKCPEPGFLRD